MKDGSEDYCAVLRVLPSAEQEVITAAYRALAKKYHPDTHSDDALAERRLKELNEAYEVLSDPSRRRKYDEARSNGTQGTGEFREEEAEDDDSDALATDWAVACGFFPVVELHRKSLRALSPQLAIAYQIHLLATKDFGKAAAIRDAFERQFLERYFGQGVIVCDVARGLLLANKRDVARKLNQAVRVVRPGDRDQFTFVKSFAASNGIDQFLLLQSVRTEFLSKAVSAGNLGERIAVEISRGTYIVKVGGFFGSTHFFSETGFRGFAIDVLSGIDPRRAAR